MKLQLPVTCLCVLCACIALILLEQNTVARTSALDLYVTFEANARKWQQSRQAGVARDFWQRPYGPEAIPHCAGAVVARTRFAIVSLLTEDASSLYTQSAIKLARSIRRWHSSDHLDLVMMITDGFGITQQKPFVLHHDIDRLQAAGWSVVCRVPIIEHPAPSRESRFHTAKLYSKLNLWGLQEYDALLYMDVDTLMLRECSRVFTVHYPAMLRSNHELAAVRDRPAVLERNFNAGVLLVIPRRPVHNLIARINDTHHEKSWAEQGLLNVLYKDRFYELSYIYNANLVSKRDEPELWEKYRNRIAIVHYTVSKGWESLRYLWQAPDLSRVLSCWEYDTDDFCRLWDRV